MTWKRRAAALLLGVLMLFTSAPVVMPVFAGGGESESAGTAVISDIHTSSVNYGDLTAGTTEDHVWEGRPARIEFSVTLDAEQDSPFAVGDIITVETNIGELFAPQNGWDKYTEQSIFDENGALLATVRIAEDGTKLVFTIAEGAAGQTKIENGYVELPALTAKEGMTAEGETAQETLTINGADGTITFHKTEASTPPAGTSIGLPDVDTFWKNAWSIDNYTGAAVSIEVNPIGSIDLYGSTTYMEAHEEQFEETYGLEAKYPNKYPREPMSYRNLYVEDEIPLQGIIDENSIQICASIPSYMVNAGEDFRDPWHKDYYIPVGVGYAQREGTLWQSLNGLAKLEQLENESKEDFKERVLSQALQWGIYEDAEGNQTFLCNFGNVGKFDDPAVESNGVTYQAYASHYVENYPDIFGENGASGGNIVSYHIAFNTYYPNVDIDTTTNTAILYAMNGSESYYRVGGNTSGQYTIINAAGIGMAKKNALEILLVDRDETETSNGITYQKPIEGGTFAIQKQEDDEWKDIACWENLATNASGRITVTNFEPGTYRVVQTDWVDGYVENENAYKDPWSGAANKGTSVSLEKETLGEFTIKDGQKYGFGALVENWKPDDPGPVEPPVTEEETTEVTVTKVWKNDSKTDRPESVTVELLRNGAVCDTVQLSDSNDWTHTFADLPVEDEDGAPYEYTAKEVSVPGYTTQITGDAEEGFIITNTKEADPDPSPDPGPGPDPSPDPSPDPGPGPDPDPDPSPDPGPGTKPDPDPDPDEPDEPAGPDTPDTPDEPGTPDVPEEPGTDIPDGTTPETGVPGEPEEPGTDIPDSTPPETDVPGEPDEPGETGEPSLPQTGQLWLPVGLLALAGAALTAAGVAGRTRRHGKRERRP